MSASGPSGPLVFFFGGGGGGGIYSHVYLPIIRNFEIKSLVPRNSN